MPILPASQKCPNTYPPRDQVCRVNAHSDDFTDQEAVATIVRITRGNIRLIDRLMMQVELVLVANALRVVTKEVVETARQNLIIGFE